MMIGLRHFAGALATLACALGGGALAQPTNAPVPLASHRAVYDLTLLKSTGAKGPAEARGRIAFEFSGSPCEGYVQNFRQITELQPSEGQARVSDMLSATFESGDARNFRFHIETKVDEARADDIDGKAQKLGGAKLAVDLAKPKSAHVELSGPVYFPTEHLRRILDAARAGESVLEAKVFDGTGDGQKIFDSLTVIGKPRAAPAQEKAQEKAPPGDELKALRRWPIAVSYFEPGGKDGQPSYVLSFDLLENGVSQGLKLDYGDFALRGEMTEFKLLPSKECGK
jgi:hypothetical protein